MRKGQNFNVQGFNGQAQPINLVLPLADFGTAQTSLHIRVAQLSATVGAGYAADVTLAV